jgi:hypothetical protein
MVAQIWPLGVPGQTRQHPRGRHQLIRRLQEDIGFELTGVDRSTQVVYVPWSHLVHTGIYNW